MRTNITIGLIGDYDATVPAHQSIPLALQGAATSAHLDVKYEWVVTEEILQVFLKARQEIRAGITALGEQHQIVTEARLS